MIEVVLYWAVAQPVMDSAEARAKAV